MDSITDRGEHTGPRPGLMKTAIVVLLWVSVLLNTVKMALANPDRPLLDFDVFYLVSDMIWRGDLAGAYRFETFLPRMVEFFGTDSFMPWTYPPPFDLVLVPLALLPQWLAFALFTGSTLALYLHVIRRLAGEHTWKVLAVVFPAVSVAIACGQNGMLTGGLIGLFCLAVANNRRLAGVPLGLMCIKPHLAIGLAVYVVASARWTVLLSAALTASAAAALATGVFGVDVWAAFLAGAAEAKVFLAHGFYPLYRMVSLYAAAFMLGAPPTVALALQTAQAIAVLALIWAATRSWLDNRQALGMAVLAAVMISPYAYDYDLPIVGVALALLAREIVTATTREKWLIGTVLPVAGIYGLAANSVIENDEGAIILSPDQYPASVGGILVLVLFAVVFRILMREGRRGSELPAAGALQQA